MAEKEYDYLAPGQGYAARHSTPFADRSLPQLKAMVVHADPEDARTAARGWDAFHADLVGGEDGGVFHVLDALVIRLTQSWRGEAAEAFLVEARRLRQRIADTAEHARYLSIALRGAANALQEYKPHIDAMTSADDTPGRLSAAKQPVLKAAVVMEQLGAAYNSQVMAMESWSRVRLAEPSCPGAPGGTVPRAEVRLVPHSVSLSHAPPSGPPLAEPPNRPGAGGVVEGLGASAEAAVATAAQGVSGGIPRQDTAGAGGRAVPKDALRAALPLHTPGPAASEGGTGLHRGR